MPGPKVEILVEGHNYLGEGPHWNAGDNSLYYVDVARQHVYRYDPTNNKNFKTYVEGGNVSIVIPVQDKKGKFVITRTKEICVMDWNGSDPRPSKVTPVTSVDPEYPKNRINDGKCDPTGRLWAGTMSLLENLDNMANDGSLYSLDKDLSVRKHLSDIYIANGLAWKDNIMYYVDTLTHRVDALDFDSDKGVIANRRPAFDLKLSGVKGLPDGMAIDASGKLWVACFRGGQVLNVDPEVGKQIGSVQFPCSNITSVAFGGPHLDVMYVTSATQLLSSDELGNQPAAGSLFQVTGTGARGLPGVSFAGKLP